MPNDCTSELQRCHRHTLTCLIKGVPWHFSDETFFVICHLTPVLPGRVLTGMAPGVPGVFMPGFFMPGFFMPGIFHARGNYDGK